MRHTALAWTAVGSLLGAALLSAAMHPRYGGTLRIETSVAFNSFDPADTPGDSESLAAKTQLVPLVFETLVRLNATGTPEPWLATSWTHDIAKKRWIFAIRPDVRLHNGTLWSAAGKSIDVSDDKPIDQILRDLSRPSAAIVVKDSEGTLNGTGPFRITRWESRKSATLSAHEGHWNGRPFLDSIEIQMGRNQRDQEQDFQSQKADVIDGSIGSGDSKPNRIICLVFDNPRLQSASREAISLAVDRATIKRVLLKDRGEASGALLPQWLSGYSFLFSARRDLSRSRELAPAVPALAFGYDRQEPILRSIGERVSLNAMEAGITLRASAGNPDVRLISLPITSRDEVSALADLALLFKVPFISDGANLYEMEKALMDNARVVPLLHVSRGWTFSRRIENWPDLPNVWVHRP